MNARPTRDGVAEVFERHRVALIMQEAVSRRYASPTSPQPRSGGADAAAPPPRLVCPLHYTVRACSRTAHCLGNDGNDDRHPAEALMTVAAECCRHDAFTALVEDDLRRLCGLAGAAHAPAGAEDSRRYRSCSFTPAWRLSPPTRPLVSRQDFCEMPPRWVMQSLGEVDQHVVADSSQWAARQNVTPLDVGATVVMSAPAQQRGEAADMRVPAPSSTTRWCVDATAPMARGAYWVDLLPLGGSQATSAVGAVRVDRAEVRLDPPVPLCVDALLPCDELYSDRGVNTGAYVFFLRALQRQHQEQRDSGRIHRSPAAAAAASSADSLHNEAAALALELSQCARRRRCELADRLRVLRDGGAAAAYAESMASAGCESDSAAGTGVTVLLQVRVDRARECLQLRAAIGAASALGKALGGKRPRDTNGSSGTQHDDGGGSEHGTNSRATELASQSPTVEVLLRTAWKLAALYDGNHAAAATTRATHAARPADARGEAVLGDAPRAAPAHTHVATALLNRLTTAHGDARTGTADAGGDGAAPRRSRWMSVHVHPQDGSASCSAPRPPGDGDGDGSAGVALTTREEQHFLARLFALLLRYRTLFGEHGYNQGPQAAVPPPVMEQLADVFAISAEAFASPLNAQLPQFGSLFPDTDAPFGSLGSFFDIHFGGGADAGAGGAAAEPGLRGVKGTAPVAALKASACHVEVNPPFDTTLLRHMEAHLLACLQHARDAAQSVLFLVVLPSHDLTDAERAAETAASPSRQTPAAKRLGRERLHGSGSPAATPAAAGSRTSAAAPLLSTERSLRESPFCLGHVLCAAAESTYVDGHQHLLQSPFFCIETPTRLMVLGNAAARCRFPDATAQLEAVRQAWRTLTASALRSGS